MEGFPVDKSADTFVELFICEYPETLQTVSALPRDAERPVTPLETESEAERL
jgi:hypothetical protein